VRTRDCDLLLRRSRCSASRAGRDPSCDSPAWLTIVRSSSLYLPKSGVLRGHASAAAVLAVVTIPRRRAAIPPADSLYAGDPYLEAAHAIYLIGLGDTAAVPLH